jgi:signal transduction histidine kinase
MPPSLFYEEVCHDLKTPISLIFAYINLLEREYGLTPEAAGHVRQIQKHSYHVARLVRDINDESRLNHGILRPHYVNCDIVAAVRGLCEDIAAYTETKKLALRFNSEIPHKIMAVDNALLRRVLLNLLANAREYSPVGGQIHVNVKERGGYVYISVRDFGTGIKPGMDVFARYTGEGGGHHSGLGLTIVRKLASLLEGGVHINRAEPGTEVVFSLPVFLTDGHQEEISLDDFFNENMIQLELAYP